MRRGNSSSGQLSLLVAGRRCLLVLGVVASATAPAPAQVKASNPSTRLPATAGPFRPAVAARGLVFFSGQTGQDPQTRHLVSGGVAAETHRALQTLRGRLQAAGLTLHDVVAVTVYLKDMAQYAQLNQVYERYFVRDFPARTCVAVAGLPGGANVEITLIAAAQP